MPTLSGNRHLTRQRPVIAAYKFDESGGVWSQSFKLHASDKAQDDEFGRVSLDGDWLVVGAPGDRGNEGSADLFAYDSRIPAWAEDEMLNASDGSSGEEFGVALARAVRGHWRIENQLHWSLDMAFRKDECRIRRGHGAENFSRLCRIALNLLK